MMVAYQIRRKVKVLKFTFHSKPGRMVSTRELYYTEGERTREERKRVCEGWSVLERGSFLCRITGFETFFTWYKKL